MALLQVRDFPQETYQILARVAKEQNRTVPQQVIFLLTSPNLNHELKSDAGLFTKYLINLPLCSK